MKRVSLVSREATGSQQVTGTDPSEDRKEEEYRSLALARYTANSSQS